MPPPSPEAMDRAIKLGHEPSTVSVKGVIWFLVILIVTLVGTFAFVWVVFHVLLAQHEQSDVPQSALAAIKTVAPEPRLQPTLDLHEHTEHQDLESMHAQENQRFAQMGWISKDGQVQIPENIANAIIQMSHENAAAPTAAAGAVSSR